MNPSRERLRALAAETGFRQDTLEKVLRLGEVLADVARHPLLSSVLVLKGGTALNLCFGVPGRLSVDLDFNYVGEVDRDRMLAARPDVERAVTQIARGQGYRVQQSADAHAGRKIFLGYVNSAGASDRIEVDLNFLFRQPLLPPQSRDLWQPGTDALPTALVVAAEELAAGKLCALLDRSAPRDLFDTRRLPHVVGDAWRDQRFRRFFVAFAVVLDHALYSYGHERLARVSDVDVEVQLWPTLATSHRPVAVELRAAAWTALEPLLALDEVEREYSDRAQVGELRPELLFPDDAELVERLRSNPALRWKVDNAREWQGKG